MHTFTHTHNTSQHLLAPGKLLTGLTSVQQDRKCPPNRHVLHEQFARECGRVSVTELRHLHPPTPPAHPSAHPRTPIELHPTRSCPPPYCKKDRPSPGVVTHLSSGQTLSRSHHSPVHPICHQERHRAEIQQESSSHLSNLPGLVIPSVIRQTPTRNGHLTCPSHQELSSGHSNLSIRPVRSCRRSVRVTNLGPLLPLLLPPFLLPPPPPPPPPPFAPPPPPLPLLLPLLPPGGSATKRHA
eukprot:1158314-Pelagomonas_calceolata.AAC.15